MGMQYLPSGQGGYARPAQTQLHQGPTFTDKMVGCAGDSSKDLILDWTAISVLPWVETHYPSLISIQS